MYAYDLEVFPNLFTATFIHVETRKKEVFVLHENQDDIAKLRTFIKNLNGETLIGYNSIRFDDMFLKRILRRSKTTNKGFHNLSAALIANENPEAVRNALFALRKTKKTWVSIDLAKILQRNKLMVSLKHTAIHLEWGKIQDNPLSPVEPVDIVNDLRSVLSYNANDVLITIALFEELKEEIALRANIQKLYGLDDWVLSASESQLADIILGQYFGDATKQAPNKEADTFSLHDCLPSKLAFNTKKLSDFLKWVSSSVVSPTDDFKGEITIGKTTYKLMKGGLHSDDKGGVFHTTDEYEIIDADVASYYPNIMLNEGFVPNIPNFSNRFEEIVTRRLVAKKEGDKVTSDALKIAINSIFGKMRFYFSWLYSPKMFYSVTLSGQLYLLDLIEKLEEGGIEVISANTDGIVAKVNKSQKADYFEICQKWENRTNFSLEYTVYDLYARRDVNNYVARTMDGKVKVKGVFSMPFYERPIQRFTKGYSAPVVAMALQQYFLEDIPPSVSIQACKVLTWFCYAQRVAKKFTVVLETANGEFVQQRTNRYVIIDPNKDSIIELPYGALTKRYKQMSGKVLKTSLVAGRYVALLNTIPNTFVDPTHLPIDYGYYIREAEKIIAAVEQPNGGQQRFNLFEG